MIFRPFYLSEKQGAIKGFLKKCFFHDTPLIFMIIQKNVVFVAYLKKDSCTAIK